MGNRRDRFENKKSSVDSLEQEEAVTSASGGESGPQVGDVPEGDPRAPFLPDLIVIDESAQGKEQQSYGAFMQNHGGPRCLLAGDHKQLGMPDISQEGGRLLGAQSLLERLIMERMNILNRRKVWNSKRAKLGFGSLVGGECTSSEQQQKQGEEDLLEEEDPEARPPELRAEKEPGRGLVTGVHFLSVTYRPSAMILPLWSNTFYGGTVKLPLSASEKSAETEIRFPSSQGPVVFHDLSGEPQAREELSSKSYRNEAEAQVICQYLLSDQLSKIDHQDIGIIALYERQVSLIQNKLLRFSSASHYLGDIEVGTAEYFQGREKRVILLSCVRTGALGFVGGAMGARRLNVALSRAMHGLVVVGSFRSALANDSAWYNVLMEAQKYKAVVG